MSPPGPSALAVRLPNCLGHRGQILSYDHFAGSSKDHKTLPGNQHYLRRWHRGGCGFPGRQGRTSGALWAQIVTVPIGRKTWRPEDALLSPRFGHPGRVPSFRWRTCGNFEVPATRRRASKWWPRHVSEAGPLQARTPSRVPPRRPPPVPAGGGTPARAEEPAWPATPGLGAQGPPNTPVHGNPASGEWMRRRCPSAAGSDVAGLLGLRQVHRSQILSLRISPALRKELYKGGCQTAPDNQRERQRGFRIAGPRARPAGRPAADLVRTHMGERLWAPSRRGASASGSWLARRDPGSRRGTWAFFSRGPFF